MGGYHEGNPEADGHRSKCSCGHKFGRSWNFWRTGYHKCKKCWMLFCDNCARKDRPGGVTECNKCKTHFSALSETRGCCQELPPGWAEQKAENGKKFYYKTSHKDPSKKPSPPPRIWSDGTKCERGSLKRRNETRAGGSSSSTWTRPFCE